MLRRNLTQSHNRAQFITAYTEAMHPEIYREADEMYTYLKELYPGKRDMRKVPQFLSLTTGIKNLNAYYYKNKMSRKTNQKKPDQDNMVLEIPLAKYTGESTSSIMPDTGESTSSIMPDTGESTSSIMPDTGESTTSIMPDTGESTSTIMPDTSESTSSIMPDTGESTSITMPDNVYKDLLTELAKDPDLTRIFNDFDGWEEDDMIIEGENIDELTPLEWELHNLGY